MGDIGALALGAALGTIAVIVRQELVVLIMGGIFVVETASVILQVIVVQDHGQAHFPHGAHPPSLRAQGLDRAQDHRALLDHHLHPGARGTRDAETPMTAAQTAGNAAKNAAKSAVIVGMGRTGLSVARHLQRCGFRIAVTDSRAAPPELAGVQALGAGIVTRTGGFDTRLLEQADIVVTSPGSAARRSVLRAGARRAASTSSATSSCSRAPRTRRWWASPAPTARAPSPPC